MARRNPTTGEQYIPGSGNQPGSASLEREDEPVGHLEVYVLQACEENRRGIGTIVRRGAGIPGKGHRGCDDQAVHGADCGTEE